MLLNIELESSDRRENGCMKNNGCNNSPGWMLNKIEGGMNFERIIFHLKSVSV